MVEWTRAPAQADHAGKDPARCLFFDGQRIARRDPSGTVYYYFEDHLGTSRVMVQAGQNTACYEADFYPFGGERVITNTCSQNYKFTGKERDSETGNDYFGARFYASNLGRFLSTDVGPPIFGNPQSWNRYAYVLNNPLRFIDPDGDYTARIYSYRFIVKYAIIKEGQTVGYQNVIVNVYVTVIFDDSGAVDSITSGAKAANEPGNLVDYSKKDLKTVAGTVARLFRQSFEKQFGPLQDKRGELSTALAMQESTLGTRAPYNPLQLSCSSGTCPRPRDVEFNVDKALDELTWRVQKYDLFKALARYNQAADPEGHAEKVLGYYEGIKATETGSEFSPEYPTAPLPQELR